MMQSGQNCEQSSSHILKAVVLKGIALASLCCFLTHCQFVASNCLSYDATCDLTLAFAIDSLESSAGLDQPTSCDSNLYCLTFITAATSLGAFGGVPGADNICNSDANKPQAYGSFKAFVVEATTNKRRATISADTGDGQIDWVLKASKEYRRADGATVIATTGSNRLFSFDLSQSFLGSATTFWTGMGTDWTSHVSNCAGFTNDSVGTGRYGDGGVLTSAAIGTTSACSGPAHAIFCIEQ
jgi:hypothetical protein